MRAAGLFRQKMSEKAIVKELRGVEGGRNYETARDEVRNLIIEGLMSDGGHHEQDNHQPPAAAPLV